MRTAGPGESCGAVLLLGDDRAVPLAAGSASGSEGLHDTPKLTSTPADYLKGNTQTSPYPISAVVLECTWWESIPKLQKRRVISTFEYAMLNRGDVKKSPRYNICNRFDF